MIEGVPHAWSSTADIIGSGGGSWIGHGGRVVLGGLQVPESITYEVKSGMPADGGASFGLVDLDGTVSHLFGNIEPDDVAYTEERLPSSSSAAPVTILAGGDSIVLHDRNIGTEAIGPSGERRWFPCFPTAALPGPQHAAASSEFAGVLSPVPVTQDPYLLEGRRVALWRLYRDDDGSWPSWTDQAAAGPPAFFGTLRVLGRVEGRVWRIKCDGPESFLRKLLNASAPHAWLRATPSFVLSTEEGQREDLIGVAFRKVTSAGTPVENGVELFSLANLLTGPKPSTLRQQIHNRLVAVAAMGVNTFSLNSPLGQVQYSSSEFLGIQIETSGSAYAGECWLILHWKVWRRLGWDPIVQDRINGDERGELDVDFFEITAPQIEINGTSASLPGGGYWRAIFRTRKVGARPTGASIAEQCNAEAWRVFRPVTPNGLSVIDSGGGQELGLGVDKQYCDGQLGRPPEEGTLGGVAMNATRWWLLKAPYRGSVDESPREMIQVFKASWVDVDGLIQQVNDRCTIKIERFEDPRLFGVNEEPLTRSWAAAVKGEGGFYAIPLATLRYTEGDEQDYVHHVLLRLLLSTGTASISGFENDDDPPVLTAGDNDHPDAFGVHHVATDAEIADLGLAIPHERVDWHSFLKAAQQLPSGWSGPLARCLVAWTGGIQAADVIRDLCQGRGLSLGLAGGKFTLFPTHSDIDLEDAVANLGASDWHGEARRPGAPPAVNIRVVEPVDRWVVQSGRHPDGGSFDGEDEIRAIDEGAPYRQSRRSIAVKALGLVPLEWFVGGGAPPDWLPDARATFGYQASTWRARPHMLVTVKVQRRVGQDLYPGDVVTITNPWPPDLNSGYGLTQQPARVVRARHYLDGGHVELVLQVEGVPGGRRRWAPIARLLDDVTTLEERYDAATKTWKCYGDAFEHGDPLIASDVQWFGEPGWSSLGGNMLVHGWQYNGVTWQQSFSFAVSSVDSAAHTITAVSPYSGTFYDRMYTLLIPAPYDVQTAAWVKATFLVVTKANGKFGGGTKGWRLGV